MQSHRYLSGEFPKVRMRRNRMKRWSRHLLKENIVVVSDLILPLFVIEGDNIKEEIKMMPGVYKLTIDLLLEKVKEAYSLGIEAIVIFPVIEANKKSLMAEESYNQDNLICRAIRKIKDAVPEIGIIVDVALDPYTSHGHDGIVNGIGEVLNDETVEILCKQALSFAEAGCSSVAPSDMMDGRIAIIRDYLDKEGYIDTQIISYAVKYSSCFYGPFRDTIGSCSILDNLDKSSYQLDPANRDEAMKEVAMDIKEGADMIIVKPISLYLDLVSHIKSSFNINIIGYQVSGEYSMLKLAASEGILDGEKAMYESLLSFKRAGCTAFFNYGAIEVAKFLNK